jgi:O-antigen ligase
VGHRSSAGFDRLVLGVVIAVEAVVLLMGGSSAQPLSAAAVAFAGVFLLLAYRAPDLAWALTWLAVPLSFEWVAPGGFALAVPSEPMIVLALVGWSLRLLSGGSFTLAPSPLHLPLAMLAGAALLSAVVGKFTGVGLKAWGVAAGYVAFGYLYIASSPWDTRRRERWYLLLVASAVVWALYGFLRLCVVGISSSNAYGAARPFFTEHGTYAAFLAMLLPLPLLLSLERRGSARWVWGAAFGIILLGVVFSFTRAAWLSVAVVLPLVLIAWASRGRRWSRLALPVAAIALSFLAVVAVGAGERLTRHAGTIAESENVSNLERLNRWMAAMEMAKEHPWLGVGYGSFADVYPAYRRKTIVTELAYRHMGAHSEPLRLLAEMGVIGLGAALWFLGITFAAGVRAARGPDETGLAALAILAGLGTYAVHGLFNSYLGIDKVSVPFWMGLGALAALSRPRREAE